jgi:hypothetical protein
MVGTFYRQVTGELAATGFQDAITRLRRVGARREAPFTSVRPEAAPSSGPAASAIDREALHVVEVIGVMQVHEADTPAQATCYGMDSLHKRHSA